MNDLRVIRVALRVFWFGLAVALFLWVALRNVPPSGTLLVSAVPGEASPFVGIPAPRERVSLHAGTEPHYDITQEPVYFPLAAPRFFHRAKLLIDYKNEGQPLIEIGGRTSKDEWAFDLRPLEARMLEDLGWAAREEGEYRVYERQPSARSVGELMNFGDPRRVAVYGFTPVRGEDGPTFHRVTWQDDLAARGYDTVVARLAPLEPLGDGWTRAEVEIDFAPIHIEHGEVQILLSAPAMKERGGAVRVRAISVAYQRPPWSFASIASYVSGLLP